MPLKAVLPGVSVAACLVATALVSGAGEQSLEDREVGGKRLLPAPTKIEFVTPDGKPAPEIRVFHIIFETRNMQSDQVIAVFIERSNGRYWPVARECLDPQILPINKKTRAAVEVVGVPRGEPFRICLYALQRTGQRIVEEWLDQEGPKEPFRTIAYATELWSIRIP